MNDRKLTETVRLSQAKQLVTDLRGIDWTQTPDLEMARVIGRVEIIVSGLIEVIESGNSGPDTAPIPEPIVNLLRAVNEALDIPEPAEPDDALVRNAILADRAADATVAIQGVLGDETGLSIPWNADYLRKRLAATPTDYRAANDTGSEAGR
ncbi:hypothetical protein [Streptomyces sp. NPDC019937]|uniref:hypothetical protein n=1 Tax=Streptomyces sp. NPDC019937 TaxID=3154787 RepID=UPI0034066877